MRAGFPQAGTSGTLQNVGLPSALPSQLHAVLIMGRGAACKNELYIFWPHLSTVQLCQNFEFAFSLQF